MGLRAQLVPRRCCWIGRSSLSSCREVRGKGLQVQKLRSWPKPRSCCNGVWWKGAIITPLPTFCNKGFANFCFARFCKSEMHEFSQDFADIISQQYGQYLIFASFCNYVLASFGKVSKFWFSQGFAKFSKVLQYKFCKFFFTLVLRHSLGSGVRQLTVSGHTSTVQVCCLLSAPCPVTSC